MWKQTKPKQNLFVNLWVFFSYFFPFCMALLYYLSVLRHIPVHSVQHVLYSFLCIFVSSGSPQMQYFRKIWKLQSRLSPSRQDLTWVDIIAGYVSMRRELKRALTHSILTCLWSHCHWGRFKSAVLSTYRLQISRISAWIWWLVS